jgi:hypothetical protein
MKSLSVGIILFVLFNNSTFCQSAFKLSNPSYRYYANPGLVNITEINGATGLGTTEAKDSRYYFGITNVIAYQIDRNFLGGVGFGYYKFDSGQLIPVYLEFRYSIYLRNVTPFVFSDGGSLLDPANLIDGTKIFINPGIGFSKSITQKLEITLSSGLTVQMGNKLPRNSFINFKLGLILRKNSFRLFKQGIMLNSTKYLIT